MSVPPRSASRQAFNTLAKALKAAKAANADLDTITVVSKYLDETSKH